MAESKVKKRILETTARLFHQQGYYQTGINQIIAEADIARGSLYLHFQSKEDLCVAYLHYKHDSWFADITSFISQHESPKDRILALFDFLIRYTSEENFRGCFFLNIVTEVPDKKNRIFKTAQNKKNIFQKYIHDLVAQYTGKHGDPLADRVYLIFEGAISESQFRKDTWPVQISKDIVQCLLED